MLQKVTQRQTTQDVVYERLRAFLISGRFEPGHLLKISSLADQFGTSHMPVREALKRLSAEGALVTRASGTAMVPQTTVTDLEMISRTRCILEGAAAAGAAGNFPPSRLAGLLAIHHAHRAAAISGNVAEMLEHNRAFHFAIYEAAENPVLLALIENLWLRYGPYIRLLCDRIEFAVPEAQKFVSSHHDKLITAMRSADSALAEQAVVEDIRGSQSLMLQFGALSGI